MSIRKFFFTLTLIMTLLIAATAGGYLVFISKQNQAASLSRLQVTAQNIARGLSGQIRQAETVLSGLTLQKEMSELLLPDNALLRAEKEKGYASMLLNVQQVRLIPLGLSDTELIGQSGIGYADLAMIRGAEKGEKNLFPGVFGLRTQDAHIAMARPIILNGEVTGVLHASFSVHDLQGLLKGAVNEDEFIALKQGGLVIAAAGDKSRAKEDPGGVQPVASTDWVVSYQQSNRLLITRLFQEWVLALIIAGVAIVVMVLIFIVMAKRLREWIRLDQVSLIKLVETLLNGQPVRGSYQVKLAEVQGTVDSILAFHRKKMVEISEDNSSGASTFSSDKQEEKSIVPPDLLYMKDGIKLESQRENVLDDSKVPASVFRAYDIRGVVADTLTPELVYEIGRALGSEAYEAGQQSVIIARDGRLSSEELSQSLARGLQDSGRDVIDLGQVPTPVLYFGTNYLGSNSGVMITGSHNPPDYNGLKMVIDGETLSGERIRGIRERILNDELLSGNGSYETREIVADYISAISGDVHIGRPTKVVVDCGNGVAGEIAPLLLRTMGCEVVELFCDIDGTFPNHHPDPGKPENLQDLIRAVQEEKADLGLAFDGDGDRLGLIDSDGNIIWPDRQMMLFSADVLSRQPGADIIFDVKCTRHLAAEIVKHGGRPLMWKTGHSLVKAKIKETGAMLAGEMSGHIFFKERWYGFDDGLYAGARMIELISAGTRTSQEIFAELPDSINTPELNISLPEGENFKFVDALLAVARFPDAKVNTIDGLRVDFSEGWGLVRASNTTPSLVLRFEADSQEALLRIQDSFRVLMKKVKPDIELPF